MSDTMRMKDVLKRTGLTDRAVRLYIDAGLLSPRQESSYTGRKSILFNEEDVAQLEVIATLRKAGFSLADIHTMKEYPERTGDVLSQYLRTLEREIGEKRVVLEKLSAIPTDGPLTDRMIADAIRSSAAAKSVPREDSALFFSDLRTFIRRQIPSVLSLVFLLLAAFYILPLATKTAFADVRILAGGGVRLDYAYTWDRFAENGGVCVSAGLLVLAIVFLFIYLAGGGRPMQITSLVLTVLSAGVFLVLPSAVREQMFLFEFIGYRHSFMYSLFYYQKPWFSTFIQSLKYVPLLAATVSTAIGIRTEDTL